MNRMDGVFLCVIVSLFVAGCGHISSNDSTERDQRDEENLLECFFSMTIMNPRLMNEVVAVKDSMLADGYILAYDYVNSSMGDISSYAIKYQPNKVVITFGWSFHPDQWITFERYKDVEIIRIPNVGKRKICISDGQFERDVARHVESTEKDLWRLLGFVEKTNSVPDDPWQ